jgi:Transposase, Mutator family
MSRLRPRSLASWRRGDQAVPPECNYDVIHRSPAKLGSSIGDCHKVPCWRTGIAVNRDGHREVRGLDAIAIEDGAGCLAFLGGLVARGLAGRSLVISDAHPGLVDARRLDAGRFRLAPLPDSLHVQPAEQGPEVRAAHGRHAARHGDS